MSTPAYRPANNGMLSCLGVCALGLVVTAGLGALFHFVPPLYAALGPWSVLVFALPFPIAIVLAGRRYGRLNRERIARLAVAAGAEGLECTTAPSAEQKAACFARFAALADPLTLRHGAERLIWWARPSSDDAGEVLFEHEYSLGSGKTTTTHPHTVLAFPVPSRPSPSSWTHAGAPFAVSRHAALLRGSTIPHRRTVHAWTDPGTQQTWAIEGHVEAAQMFLIPAVQQILATAPRGEWWYFGHNWLCCVYQSKIDASQLRPFLAHAREVPQRAFR